MRVLELFCGLGGCAAALGDAATVVAAVDVDRGALAAYAGRFPHPTHALNLETVPASWLRRHDADLWWMSPPCQPHTVRGSRRDAADPRSRALLALLDRLGEVRPRVLALENVPGFAGSEMHRRLRRVLADGGYRAVVERELCPSQLGVPNRRRRFYLVASRDRLRPPPQTCAPPRRPLADYLDARPAAELALEPAIAAAYRRAIDVVDAGDPAAVTACFTAAYGRSPVRSGSYLREGDGLRRFSPDEVARLLGYGPVAPPLAPREAWRRLGAGLSIPAVRAALAVVPELAALGAELALGAPRVPTSSQPEALGTPGSSPASALGGGELGPPSASSASAAFDSR